jgi:hypothetical protein
MASLPKVFMIEHAGELVQPADFHEVDPPATEEEMELFDRELEQITEAGSFTPAGLNHRIG